MTSNKWFQSIDDVDPDVIAAAKEARERSRDDSLASQFTTGNGRPTKYTRLTKALCPTCIGATGGSVLGVTVEHGSGQLTLECTNGYCGQVLSTLEARLPK